MEIKLKLIILEFCPILLKQKKHDNNKIKRIWLLLNLRLLFFSCMWFGS